MSALHEHESAVGILMPSISNSEMFAIRYSGLERKLGLLGLTAAFAFSHDSYDPIEHRLVDLKTTSLELLYEVPAINVVRDLTVPKDYEKPIYQDEQSPLLIHNPEFNQALRQKDKIYELLPDIHPVTIVTNAAELEEAVATIPGYRVIIKPLRGAGAKGVKLIRKKNMPEVDLAGDFLVQEYIDTSSGDPNLGIEGTHNLRVISIGSEVVGAVARVGGKSKSILRSDGHGEVFDPEKLPEEVHKIIDQVHESFAKLPGKGKNVIAIDLMYGRSTGREPGYVICEINHRPVRISPWDLRRDDTQDPQGMLWLGAEWDKAEAKMMHDIATNGSKL